MRTAAALVFAILLAGCAALERTVLTIGTTTTTQDSGLLDLLVPAFERDEGIPGRAVVGGTEEIIEKGKRGDVDVLFTHSPSRERALVDAGTAMNRTPVMYNLFVVAGTDDDPAGVREAIDAADAFRRIHDRHATFVSRGDRSGTHEKELSIWQAAGLDPTTFSHDWYKQTGTGQGTTLIVAAELEGYMLIDEGTLLQFHAKGKALSHLALFSSDSVLRNQYAVTRLDPAAIPAAIETEWASRFAAWLTGPAGQALVASYQVAGKTVFTPNADDTAA